MKEEGWFIGRRFKKHELWRITVPLTQGMANLKLHLIEDVKKGGVNEKYMAFKVSNHDLVYFSHLVVHFAKDGWWASARQNKLGLAVLDSFRIAIGRHETPLEAKEKGIEEYCVFFPAQLRSKWWKIK